MSAKIVWTKERIDAFLDEGCLTEDEEAIFRAKIKGWSRTKQALKYNMSIRKVDYIMHALKLKYDEAQKASNILPPRNGGL